jgi:hypothetical protein
VAIASDGSLIDPTTGDQLAINDPRVTNGVVQCGASGQKSGCVKGHLFNPGPRIGFAYDPWGDGKTAIRGGYGIFFEHGNGNEANVESLEATPPLVLVPNQPNIIGYTNIGSGGGEILAFPLGFNTIDTKGVWPYVQQWNLNVQHEFPFHLISSIAYVGSKGTHLGRAFDTNQVAPVSDSANPYKVGKPIGSDDCGTFTTPSGVPVTGQAAINLGIACGGDPNPFRPFLGYGSLPFIQYQANSSYSSLQVAVTRSLAPLTLSLAYTYSHSLDDSSDRFDSSYVYSLPFFKNASKPLRTALGDWQWAGIMSIQTGTPFNVLDSNFSDNAGVSNGTSPDPGTFVDLVGDPHSAAGSCARVAAGPQLYNPCAFADPRGLTFGDAGRNILRNPRTTNFDMSLAKSFKINESTGFQFRAEAFNVFNHTQWSGVSNDFTSTDFLHPTQRTAQERCSWD